MPFFFSGSYIMYLGYPNMVKNWYNSTIVQSIVYEPIYQITEIFLTLSLVP